MPLNIQGLGNLNEKGRETKGMLSGESNARQNHPGKEGIKAGETEGICLSPNRTTPQTAQSREGDRRNPSEIKEKCCRQRSDVFILDVLLTLRQGYVEIQYQTN